MHLKKLALDYWVECRADVWDSSTEVVIGALCWKLN